MGRICAWCGAVLRGTGISDRSVSHALCRGCLADLELALAEAKLRVRGG